MSVHTDEADERTSLLSEHSGSLIDHQYRGMTSSTTYPDGREERGPHSFRSLPPESSRFMSQPGHPSDSVGGRGVARRRYHSGPDRGTGEDMAEELGYEVLSKPENLVEAHKMANNYMFGFRKWKSHVTSRPLAERSQIVQELYQDQESITDGRLRSTCSLGNILYTVLFGWWVALFYLIVAGLMTLTVVGFPYSKLCVQMAFYMLWPFGKFVHKNLPSYMPLTSTDDFQTENLHSNQNDRSVSRSGYRFSENHSTYQPRTQTERYEDMWNHSETNYWRRPATYVWLILGMPILFLVHLFAFLLSWIPVIFIPVSKVNSKTIQRVLLLPPELLRIDHSSLSSDHASGDIIMYTHQAVNVYYYKYTVDGVNVICVNLLAVVAIAIGLGYGDHNHKITGMEVKFCLSLLSIIPLAYYISMAISSVSAQTNAAIGAVLNATFGSIVEIILYIASLVKGGSTEGKEACFTELVKSALVGSLLATTLLIPGLSMVIGGIKHSSQIFNYRAAGITATLLFVSVAGAFAPSFFARAFGTMGCEYCRNVTEANGTAWGLECAHCEFLTRDSSSDTYEKRILPLVYACCSILPLAYILGLVYSLKTHHQHIYETFASEVRENQEGHSDIGGHHSVHWGRLKSLFVLLSAVTLMSLCAELVVDNIEPILGGGTISVYFLGASLLAIVPSIPEIVVGIQFALQNNIALSIEVGSCVAVQVCMVQIPALVFANLIHYMNFTLIFSDVHIYAVVISILLNNYVLQDGKSNYFQGAALVSTYLILIMMYFFAPNFSSEGQC